MTVTKKKIQMFQTKFTKAGERKKSFLVNACGPVIARLLAFPYISWNLGLIFRGLSLWSRTPGALALHMNFPICCP